MVSALIAALPLLSVAQAAIIEHWWNISYTTANPDSRFERRVIGVNGTWPPPVLEATQGDVHLIHAYNGMGDDNIPTALHAHGMFFNNTNYWDGATGVTQCGIPNGKTLDYHIDTSLHHGTYWVHGHYDGQYVDGLRTPSIIHPKDNRTDGLTWDDEYTLIVSDWYHEQHHDLKVNEFLSWTNPTGAEPIPKSAVCYVVHNGQYIGNIANGEGVTADVKNNAKINFQPGKKYRIRIINMSALAMFHIGIGGHKWSVIETDGIDTVPYEIDLIEVAVAQRFSMYVEALNQTTDNFAFNIMQSPDMYDAEPEDLPNPPHDLNVNNTIQIVYNDNAPAAEIMEYESWGDPMDDTWFVPLAKEVMVPADVEYTVHANFDTYDDGTNRASFTLDGGFQNTTYRSPNVPSIFTAMTMGQDATNHAIYGAQTSVIPLEHLKMIQLNVHNWDAGFHPFHLHGHVFQVVYKSFDVTSNDNATNPPFNPSQENPARRDTVTIPPGGMVSLRFRADNPGAWFFHCHIDWHLTSGLALVFVEAPDVMQQTLQIPQQLKDLCTDQHIPAQGNVVGKFSTTDFKGQPWGPFPVVMGWTPKAIGAMAGCIITFLVGFATIVWYGTGELNEEDLEEEVRRHIEAKANKKPLWKKVARRS
ncbi:hypothetical protein CcaverHIS002_0406880 [Cutaneotrichosporon cavernicola]|uniref:Ferro-O2-oxidoreductase n=1 Tax=Cutaneotrichosporon cavernicola TaxID=279322 RepID=A0AA48L4K7_9TREE|nr:uncharacterized protein CcaverHIS019_0406890 [Cutaneotrichosporon cavernicola]BEI84084.1 hypothetical protein CcaverHIS002_0406880 [Cutaneotrichosporon cavernicola]BEI91869.1 hypothetical protein CcaverHIS019_0406890 [Cutaneotrichosporon cavernicola]BEI99641.1 hypothetical protein CcaverHIS631_0406840 [Cutaneotrichosporon cavernicola]BEJ07415.1 hypothetical protein CcaverHIS641_0406840 [Cutaneotrichosporon cavernicola]